MTKSPKVLLVLLTLAVALATAVAWFLFLPRPTRAPLGNAVAAPPLDVGPLEVEAYADRFFAAMELVHSNEPELDLRLEQTLGQNDDAGPTRDALEFVRWKRSGEPLPPASSDAGARPSVLLVSIDTLRADHLGCYGYPRDTSPHIDALAKRGVVFENAFTTAPWTLPGHMSIFTSLYPSFHKLESRRQRLDPAVKMLTESIHDVGYRTAGFVTHPFLAEHWGFGTGFDLYFRHPRIVEAQIQTDSVIDWLDWHLFHRRRGGKGEEFFLFVHYMDPHETYAPPEPFRSKFTEGYQGELSPDDHLVTMFYERDFLSQADFDYALGLYDGEISYVDHALGRILDYLEATGLLDSMIVVLTSDHGEEFKDHGSMGHQSSLHREQLQVPLVLIAPGLSADTHVAKQASLVDIYPTVARLVGAEVPSQVQGVDLRNLVEPGATAPPRYAELGPLGEEWSREFHMKSIRTDRYRLIADFDEGSKALFDLQNDPGERTNLYSTLRGRRDIRSLEQALERFTKAGANYSPDSAQRPAVTLDDGTKQQLRALGYIK